MASNVYSHGKRVYPTRHRRKKTRQGCSTNTKLVKGQKKYRGQGR